MTTLWKQYWERHVRKTGDDEPMRRVQRTLEGRSISQETFERIAARALEQLDLRPDHDVLDLCCGNGLFAARIEPLCRRVLGVDFCEPLVQEARRRVPHATFIVGDVTEVELPQGSFDRVLLASALQHFDLGQVLALLGEIRRLLRDGGIAVVTDVPDSSRIWAFYDSEERVAEYFRALGAGTPIIGTWFEPSWLKKAAVYAGFRRARVCRQPPDFPYSHYRIDFDCSL